MSVPIVDAQAPAERLAAFRLLAAGFTLTYLVIRLPVFLQLRHRTPSSFEPVGVLSPLDAPLPGALVLGTIAAALVSGLGVIVGWRYRIVAPIFAAAMLLLATYRGS